MRTNVHLPDELVDRARQAGLNLSATLRDALTVLLDGEPDMPMLAAVDALVEGAEWGNVPGRAALGELARALAAKLDSAAGSRSAAMAAAAAQLARELRSLIELIASDDDDNAEFVAGLFAGLEGSAIEPEGAS